MQIIWKIINSVGCPRHITIASKLSRIKIYLGGVFWVFHGILALFDMYEQRIWFLSREPDFQEFLKKSHNMFSWCFLSVSWYFFAFFDIIRHLSRESDFSAKNRIFKSFLKFLRACLVKGIQNGCPCIVEIRGTQGCALVGDPARAVGECRDVAKAQP